MHINRSIMAVSRSQTSRFSVGFSGGNSEQTAKQPEPLPGGGACSQDPLTFLDFIPCSPLLKPLVPKNDFSSCSLDPQNYCAVPLIPRNFYPCSPYLFTCFTFLFIVKEIAFEPPLSSPCSFMLKIHRPPFLSTQLTQLPLRQ